MYYFFLGGVSINELRGKRVSINMVREKEERPVSTKIPT